MNNWPNNLSYSAARYHQPESIDALQRIVSSATQVKVIGSRHSFTDIADTPGDLISLDRMPRCFELDTKRAEVTVNANMTYIELGQRLHTAGYALHNLASLPHISVIGACMTATHGSGNRLGSLASAVVGLKMITADGQHITHSREKDGPAFDGLVVSLGSLGVVTQVTLAIEPSYQIRQQIYNVPAFELLEKEVEGIMASHYSVSLFTKYGGAYDRDQTDRIWVKQRLQPDEESPLPDQFLGAVPRTTRPEDFDINPIDVPGPWYQRLPHFRATGLPADGHELQTEYILPREYAQAALQALQPLHQALSPVLRVSEIRTVAADNLWMSPFYKRDAVCVHFTWHPNGPGVASLMPKIEEALAPFDPRPHWGKLFSLATEQIRQSYPKFNDFKDIVEDYDPKRKFRNRYLDSLLFG